MEYVLRPAALADEGFLRELFDDVHSGEFSPLGLPASALSQLLAMQYRAQRMSYEAQFPNATDEIVWIESTRAGRLLVDESASEIRLIDVALLGSWRGQGVGASILEALCMRARQVRLPLRLSVRFGNRAERLYQRLGFVRTGGDGMNMAMELRESIDRPSEVSSAQWDMKSDVKVEQGLTRAYFTSLIGSRVTASASGDEPVELLVATVQPLMAPKTGAEVDMGDSFTVTFHGPAKPALPSACVELRPEEGEPMVIFLAPLGIKHGEMEYEAIFNRMVP